MIPRTRLAAGAALLLALVGLTAGCGGGSPEAAPTGPAATSAATRAATTPTTTASPADERLLPVAGAVLLVDYAGAGGLYTLRDGKVSLWFGNTTFAFSQTAVVSPQGSRLAYVAVGDGREGKLLVINSDGSNVEIGPETLTSEFLPVWAPDGASVLAVDANAWVRVAVPSGTVTPVKAPDGYSITRFSPDLAYVLLGGASGQVVAHLDGSGATPALAPAGRALHRTLSVSPNGHDVIADVEAPDYPGGDPGRAMHANAIVDVRTGTVQPVPGGGDLTSGYYLPDGDAILRVSAGGADTVRLVSPAGQVLAEQTVPASAAEYGLVGYVAAA